MKKCIGMGLVLLATGCSSPYATNGENLYKASYNGPGVTVPYPLTAGNLSHFYDLPGQLENPEVSIAPPRVI